VAGWKTAASIGSAFLLLAACDQLSGNNSGVFGGGTSQSETEATIGGYVAAYNKLADSDGLYGIQRTYNEMNIPNAGVSSELFLVDIQLAQALKAMRDARAASRGPADLDKAADRVIAALDAATKRTAGLAPYYQSKAYRADNLARGKAEDGPMKAEFAAAATATEAFLRVLDRERGAVDVRQMAALKASGDAPRYLTNRAVTEAQELIDAFPDEASLADSARYKVADAALAKLEATMKELAAAVAASKADPRTPEGLNARYDAAMINLNMAVGSYRTLRTTKSAESFNTLVERYNGAVQMANMLPARR